MGCDAQSYLAFGVDLGPRLPAAFVIGEYGFFDFDDFILAAAGLVKPSSSSPEYDAFKGKHKKALDDCPASFCCYGGEGDYKRYALFVNGTDIAADADGATFVDLAKLQVDEKRVEAFVAFCAAHGILAKPSLIMVCRS